MPYKKLTVGDMNAFDRYRKEEVRKNEIFIARELYGDNIPDGQIDKINAKINVVKGLSDAGKVTPEEMQFLIYRSMLKSNPDITLKEAGDLIEFDKLDEIINEILPSDNTVAKKKPARKKKNKDN
jgi:hypothetical protein